MTAIANAEKTPPAELPPCLISVVGVERFLGAPFRVISKESGTPDTEWLRARVAGMTGKAVRLFAHLGLESVDNMGSQIVEANIHDKAHAAQLQGLLASYCFSNKLVHLTRALRLQWWCLALCESVKCRLRCTPP